MVWLHTKYISGGPHGFREKQKLFFFSIINLWELMTPGAWQVGPQGHDWQGLCKGPLNIATY